MINTERVQRRGRSDTRPSLISVARELNEQANRYNEDPLRPRKLLLNRHEIRRLIGKVEEKGLTLIPLDIYFRRGYAKVTLALARGRKTYDKREKLKRRTQEDEARRAMDRYQ